MKKVKAPMAFSIGVNDKSFIQVSPNGELVTIQASAVEGVDLSPAMVRNIAKAFKQLADAVEWAQREKEVLDVTEGLDG